MNTTHSYESPVLPAPIVGGIRSNSAIRQKAHISEWASPEEISGYTTWQLQQLRRIAKSLRRMPWHDNQMQGVELMELTRDLLVSRGAIR